MRLTLINDLPLFCQPDRRIKFEQIVHDQMEALIADFPASTDYVGFPELVQTWQETISGVPADVIVLVGTRPPLLTALVSGTGPEAKTVQLTTRREHDNAGHTARVEVLKSSDPQGLRHSRRILIADDVAMSATTMSAVLSWEGIASTATRTVRIGYATTSASQRLRAEHPTANISVVHPLAFAPVTEGTVIFLTSLFFGSLRNQPFLCQNELLQPFFGQDLRPLHNLRDCTQRFLPHPTALFSRETPIDGKS